MSCTSIILVVETTYMTQDLPEANAKQHEKLETPA
jgi:hypothetical protein